MDGIDLWASTLAQLMAVRKPSDTWELLSDEDLVAGQVEGNGHQYRLRGLARFECGHCQWGWGSAHVHILFHLWWDEGRHLGLVKMRIWGQQCHVCPPEDVEPCRVSLLNVRLFLGKLVLYILHKCYREGPDTQYPEIGFGERCEACDKGVCFFLKPRDPAWGPEAKPRSVQGRYKLFSHETNEDRPSYQQLLALGSGTLVERIWGDPPNTIPLPFSAADFIRGPLAKYNSLIDDDDIVTVPFSLDGVGRARGPFACALPEGSTLGKGSIYLPTKSTRLGQSEHIAVTICEPVYQGRGILFNRQARNFQGFIFKGHGSLTRDEDTGNGQSTTRRHPQGMAYIVGFMDSGEGSVTFPVSLATLVTGKDPFTYNDGSVTFPFIYTDDDASGKDTLEGRGRGRRRRRGGRGRGARPGAEANGELPVSLSKGSVSLPFSIFTLIKRTGPQSSRLFYRYYRRQRQRRRRDDPWGWAHPLADDFCCLAGCCEPSSESNEDFWIWVSTIFFILWVIFLHKTSPDRDRDM